MILYGRSYLRLNRFIGLARRRGSVTVLDVTEGIERFSGAGGQCSPLYWDQCFGTRLFPRRIDLMAAISRGLAQRAREAGAARVTLLPAIEDWSVLPEVPPTGSTERPLRLFIFGALLAKDDPALLTEVATELANRKAKVSLEFIGRYEASPAGREWAKRLATVKSGMVRLHGAPPADRLASVLAEADAFLMLRPNTVAEQLAFPTRLVELLKFGRPILVSDVGDVSHYLCHREHALLLPAGDAVAAVDLIQELALVPDRGRALGLAGRAQGRKCFDRVTCVQALLREIDAVRAEKTGGSTRLIAAASS